MRVNTLLAGIVASTTYASMGVAVMAGDPVAGERVFKKCKVCHSVEAGKKKTAGPNLLGVFGRQAGAVDFKFSTSMAEAGEAGLVWTPETVDAYILDPKAFLQEYLGVSKVRNKMPFMLRREGERADVIAYLLSLSE